MARPQKKYSEEDKIAIKKAYKKCKDTKEQKRLLCLKLRIVKGFSSKYIAQIVGYCSSFVDHIISTYNKQGLTGIDAKKQVGNRKNLTFEQEKELLDSFSKQAENGKVLEVSDIISGYEKLIGREVAKSIVYKMLKRYGWRKVMPRSQHPNKASIQEIDAYKKNHSNSTRDGKFYIIEN
jgi:transposase